MSEAVPKEWAEARALVADRLQGLTDSSARHERRLQAIEEQARETRRAIKNATWLLSGVVAVACLIGSTVVVTASRHFTVQALAPAALSQGERIEEIVDVLPDIGTDIGERRASGRPTVAAVRRALPQVRGITAAEIQSACLMVPAACKAP